MIPGLVAYCDKWLSEQKCSLWPAVSFDISDPRERAQAAQWLAQLITELEGDD